MVAVQAYLSGKQAYILIVNPFPPSWTLIEVHPLFESFTHPSPRLWKHTHPPRLADWLWALIDNRSSKSPPLCNCSVFIGNMAGIIVFVNASLNLYFYCCFWCWCTSIVQLPLVIWSPLCTTTPILWKFLFSRGRKFLRNWTKFCQFASAVTQCSHWLSWTKCLVEQRSIRCANGTLSLQDIPSPLQVAWIEQLWQKPIKLKRNFRRKENF